MKKQNPASGEVSRGPLPSITPASLTLSTLRVQRLALLYGLPLEAAAIVATLVFGGLR